MSQTRNAMLRKPVPGKELTTWEYQRAYYQCKRKMVWDREEYAETAMKKVKKRNIKRNQLDQNIGLNVYRCPWCNKFHIGRDPFVRKSGDKK